MTFSDQITRSRHFLKSIISGKRRVLKTNLLLQKRKLYQTYGMVLCLVTLTKVWSNPRDLNASRGFVSISWDSCFVILVTHPMSYIETTDRRDFGGKPSKWRWGWCYHEDFRNFVVWTEPDPKTAFFAFLGAMQICIAPKTCLAGWLSVTAGIVSKRLNLS